MARLNPNPRLEKLKEFRRQGDRAPNDRGAGFTWYCRNSNGALRSHWRCRRWLYEHDETLTFSTFSHRHAAGWVLW